MAAHLLPEDGGLAGVARHFEGRRGDDGPAHGPGEADDARDEVVAVEGVLPHALGVGVVHRVLLHLLRLLL